MSQTQPQRRFVEFRPTGVLNEGQQPLGAGERNNLTGALNIWYRRFGAWGKRTGSDIAYTFDSVGPHPGIAPSGTRWYRGQPSQLTQLVVFAQGAMWIGGDPGDGVPLHQVATFPSWGQTPIDFCEAFDPSANAGDGSDVLIITGLTGPYGFATGDLLLDATAANPVPGQVITINLENQNTGYTVQPVPYLVLPTDNLDSIAAALVQSINNSLAVTKDGAGTSVGGPAKPFLNQALIQPRIPGIKQVHIKIAALSSGTIGNLYTYDINVTPGVPPPGMSVSPTASIFMLGGGATVTNPLKWNGSTLEGLSPYITMPFTGCMDWHSHVWFWGDHKNPDTVFASDINEPAGWAFMTANGGGGTTGGYDIGNGDGDPFVRALVPIGNLLYTIKSSSIYAIVGYDFQSGEYQFQVSQQIAGYGTPYKECIGVLHNALVFWDGTKFLRVQVGAFDVEEIGPTIPFTSGVVQQNNQRLMRMICGDFFFPQVPLSGDYVPPNDPNFSTTMAKIALFAVDLGNGAADTTLYYDDAASAVIGEYAWAPWDGFTVDAWIVLGKNKNAAGTVNVEPPALLWIPPAPNAETPLVIRQFGLNANFDVTADGDLQPINTLLRTGWIDCGSGFQHKQLHHLHVALNATPGVTIESLAIMATPIVVQPSKGPGETSTTQRPLVEPTVTGIEGIEAYTVVVQEFMPSLSGGYGFMLRLTEAGNAGTYEFVGVLLDILEEPLRP